MRKIKNRLFELNLPQNGLKALSEDGPIKKRVVVCLEKEPRRLDSNIEILPWDLFLEKLWSGDFKL